jgi:hypothetical protein
MPDSGCGILDIGCLVLDTGYRMMNVAIAGSGSQGKIIMDPASATRFQFPERWVSSIPYQASSIIHQASSIKYQVSGIEHPASGIQYQASSYKLPRRR